MADDAIANAEQIRIFSLVVQASQSMQTNPQEAGQHLEKLKDTIPKTIDSLEKNKPQLDEKQ